MNDLLDPMKNPVTYAVPFFLLTIAIELAALKWLDHEGDDRPPTGYQGRDARTSMGMGAISLAFSLALKVGSFLVYIAVFELVTPPLVGWTPLLIGGVLLYVAVTGPSSLVIRKNSASLFSTSDAE